MKISKDFKQESDLVSFTFLKDYCGIFLYCCEENMAEESKHEGAEHKTYCSSLGRRSWVPKLEQEDSDNQNGKM